jgi:hypothetical protein
MLPIIESTLSPNVLYQHSTVLFWAVVSVGSQRYTGQPTLAGTLALPITQLILQSTIARNNPVERMKALILLLSWPFPAGPFYRDPSFVLSGTLLHMAMHCGLYTPSLSQDPLKTLNHREKEFVQRIELWAYIIVTYQRYVALNLTHNIPNRNYQDLFSQRSNKFSFIRTFKRGNQFEKITGKATGDISSSNPDQ